MMAPTKPDAAQFAVPGSVLGADLRNWAGRIVDIILLVGAHRTATTTFQSFLRCNRAILRQAGVAFWTPEITGSGLLAGLMADLVEQPGDPDERAQSRRARSAGIVAVELALLRQSGARQLIVSDPAMLGTLRGNLETRRPYVQAGERLSRIGMAFGASTVRVGVAIRSYDTYWGSVLARSIGLGAAMPTSDRLDRLVTQPRRWRHVITDIARAVPGVDLLVWPYERFAGRPEAQLALLTDGATLTGPLTGPLTGLRDWQKPGPRLTELGRRLRFRGDDAMADHLPPGDGRWQPFDAGQVAVMRTQYQQDLDWLRSGKDRLARLAPEMTKDVSRAGQTAGISPAVLSLTKGHPLGKQQIVV